MHKAFASFSLSALALVACTNDPPTPTSVRSQITTNLGHVLTEAKAASDGSTAQLPGSTAFALVDKVWPGGSTAIASRLATFQRATTNPSKTPNVTGATSSFDPDAAAKWLNENLFTDANYLGNGIYTVPASLVCSTTSIDGNGTTTTVLDPDCAAKLADAQLQIRVEENDSTLTFAVQLDADHDEPLSFSLGPDSVGLTVDLDGASHAMIALAPIFGQTAPNAQLAGAVSANLSVPGPAHAIASLSIDRDVSIAVADQGSALDGPDAFRFTSATAQVGSIELDGNAKQGSLSLGLAATTAHIPGDSALDLDLPGATFKAAFADGQPLAITHLGLGDRTTTVSKNGQRAIAIDLDPADGRALDATITADAASGTETLTVSPKLDVRVAIDHAVLGDTTPTYDVTQLLLDGQLRGTEGSDGFAVVSGELSIVTNPAQYGVTATAGQCVASQDVSGYTQWTVGACQ